MYDTYMRSVFRKILHRRSNDAMRSDTIRFRLIVLWTELHQSLRLTALNEQLLRACECPFHWAEEPPLLGRSH